MRSRRYNTDLPASSAPLSTRQKAKAFNQPLSFDTSSVQDFQEKGQMYSGFKEMFEVH